MVSPTRRKEAVKRTQQKLDVSERRACRALRQPRSTQRYKPMPHEEEQLLIKRMHEHARCHPRYGYRRVWALLRQEGQRVNVKRIYRLWRREGLKVPQRQRQKRRLGSSANGIVRYRAEYINHVWCYDFISDQTMDGRTLKMLTIEDEFTRENLAIEVSRSITSRKVIEILRYLFEVRGVPKHIRSDNGPEFIAQALRQWLEDSGVKTLYIEPGAPWENAYGESFHSRFRDELLNRELFACLTEAKVVVEDFRLEYNHRRPHSSLDYMTPAVFAASCGSAASAAPGRVPCLPPTLFRP